MLQVMLCPLCYFHDSSRSSLPRVEYKSKIFVENLFHQKMEGVSIPTKDVSELNRICVRVKF